MRTVYLYELYYILQEKFPDAVEYRAAEAGIAKEGDRAYQLVELEPETEVYGVMSPITHIAYLHIQWKDYYSSADQIFLSQLQSNSP